MAPRLSQLSFSGEGAPLVIAEAAVHVQWPGYVSHGDNSEFDRISRDLEDLARVLPLRTKGKDHAVFVDTDGGGPGFVRVLTGNTGVVVAVCTSHDGDTPALDHIEAFTDAWVPKTDPLGSLSVAGPLVVANSAFSAAKCAELARPSGEIGSVESHVPSGGRFDVEPGTYDVFAFTGEVLEDNEYGMVFLRRRG